MQHLNGISGKKFGRLTVLNESERKGDRPACLCKCDCGKYIVVQRKGLTSGNNKSCGCLAKDILNERNFTHRMSKTNIYKVWQAMKKRCFLESDKNFNRYGERGITVCKKWLNFDGFYKDMGEKYKNGLTLDRIDNDGNYCKENCRWATRLVQSRNRENTKLITINGKTKALTEWCKLFKLNTGNVYSRINRGWSIFKALEVPEPNLCLSSDLESLAFKDDYKKNKGSYVI